MNITQDLLFWLGYQCKRDKMLHRMLKSCTWIFVGGIIMITIRLVNVISNLIIRYKANEFMNNPYNFG